MKEFFGWIAGIVVVIVLFMAADYSGMLWNSFIGPKKENIRREIFEQTKSFNQGMIMQLVDYRKQYMIAKDPTDKSVIANTVSHMFADYKDDGLDSELKAFLRECKYNQ